MGWPCLDPCPSAPSASLHNNAVNYSISRARLATRHLLVKLYPVKCLVLVAAARENCQLPLGGTFLYRLSRI